ncbi:MAG: right-handed parallel beta-helix repeat-containing protein [Chthoniobacterales bacterium]|nr:right-handed parallel beta-helix repeat-containing protein [Chthoniobacterales bacterium]
MKRNFSRFVPLCGLPSFLLSAFVLPLTAADIIDPPLVMGANAIDPTGGSESGTQTVDQTAPGSFSQAELEALPDLGAIQDFTGWGIQGVTSYLIFTDERRADVKGTYENLTGSTAGGATNIGSQKTSDGKGIKINSGSTKSTVLNIDFGSATYSGSLAAFDSLAKAPTAAGLTISGLNNVSTNVTVIFYGTDDTTPLFTGTAAKYVNGLDPDVSDGNTYGSDAYVGYHATGTGAMSGIGKIRIQTNQVLGASAGIGIDDLAYTASGKAYYMSGTGSGLADGSNFSNALPFAKIRSTLNATMVAGDTLYLASGTYTVTGTRSLDITTSGSAGKPKRVVGVSSGTSRPVLVGANWSPANPSGTNPSSPTTTPYCIKLDAGNNRGVSHWEFENLELRNVIYGVEAEPRNTPPHGNLVFRNLKIHDVRYGLRMMYCNDVTVENVSAERYTRSGFHMEFGCNRVNFNNCTADNSGGDPAWWNYSESIPYGFVAAASGSEAANADLSFTNCLSKNNRFNNGQQTFWNGDGFDTEEKTIRTTFTGCISINNEDAGFDCKQATNTTMNFKNCRSLRNSIGFKAWSGTFDFNNCVAAFNWRRGTASIVSGTVTKALTNDVDGFAVQNGVATINYCTVLISGTDSPQPPPVIFGLRQRYSGTVTTGGVVTGSDNIIAFGGTFGGTVSGQSIGAFVGSYRFTGTATGGTLQIVNSATYKYGDPLPPLFVDPNPNWDGHGQNMDSDTYGLTKGYHSARP